MAPAVSNVTPLLVTRAVIGAGRFCGVVNQSSLASGAAFTTPPSNANRSLPPRRRYFAMPSESGRVNDKVTEHVLSFDRPKPKVRSLLSGVTPTPFTVTAFALTEPMNA